MNALIRCCVVSAEECEGMNKFLSETMTQWRNLSVEVRSVRSMLEEVISNWEKYSSKVASLQAWLEDAEQMLNHSENDKRVCRKEKFIYAFSCHKLFLS